MKMEATLAEFYGARGGFRVGAYVAAAFILAGLIQWWWGLAPGASSDTSPVAAGSSYMSPYPVQATTGVTTGTPVVSDTFIPKLSLTPKTRPETKDADIPTTAGNTGLMPKERDDLENIVIDPSGDGSSLQPSRHPELESLETP